MSFMKDPSKFPKAYSLIFEKAKTQKHFEFDCEDNKRAIHVRHQLHAYRRALEAASGRNDLRGISITVSDSKVLLTNNEEFLNRISGAQLTDVADAGDSTEASPSEASDTTAKLSEEKMNEYLEQLDKELKP